MSNYKTKSNDIIRCKDCIYNPSVTKGFSKYVCPLVVVDGDVDYIRTPDDDWFCANGGYISNYETKAKDIVRCKDCIYNPFTTEGFIKYSCPLVAGDKYYSETPPDDNWFCANGTKSNEKLILYYGNK